jgi:hypothetical protein
MVVPSWNLVRGANAAVHGWASQLANGPNIYFLLPLQIFVYLLLSNHRILIFWSDLCHTWGAVLIIWVFVSYRTSWRHS